MSVLSVMFGPDYRGANPYQDLLYSAVGTGIEVYPGTVSGAVEKLKNGGGPLIYHLHWEEHILKSSSSPRQAAQTFIRDLEAFKDSNGKLVWTRHNARAHVADIQCLHGELVPHLSAIADIVHVHSWAAAEALSDELPLEKTVVIGHGNYIGHSPTFPSVAAREKLHIDPESHVFLIFGRLDSYKNIPQTIAAFLDLPDETHLLVAGKVVDPEIAKLAAHPRVTLVPDFIETSEVGLYFAACDTVVLSYRESLTSGTGILAAGFGKGILGSDTPGLRDLFDERSCLFFDKGQIGIALAEAVSLGREKWKNMGQRAKGVAQVRDWQGIGHQWSNLFFRLHHVQRPGEIAGPGLVS